MKDINVQYTTFISIFGKAPVYYQIINDTKYILFSLTDNLFITCLLVNSSDITDFTSNYLSISTQVDAEDDARLLGTLANNFTLVSPRAILGTAGQSPAKGLGGFAPDPTNNPYQPAPDEVVSLYVDGEGSLVTRGAVLTDEGSIRDDFTGSSLSTNLTGTVTFTNGSNIITGSGTSFTSELSRDCYIKLSTDDGYKWAQIERVPNDTYLTIRETYGGSSGSGTGQKTRWIDKGIGGVSGTATVSSSQLTLSSGTNSTGGIYLYRTGDYLPILSVWTISISNRIANQMAFFGFRDNVDNPSMCCSVLFDGTNNTVVKFRSMWDGDTQISIVNLPSGLDTSQKLRYKIDVSPDYCALLINGILVAKHEDHIPDLYSDMNICAGIVNQGATSDTSLNIDNIFVSNQDQVQMSSTFLAPIPTIIREDQHSIIGKLTTTSTTADQVILSYTVPVNNVFYIIGYKIDTSGSSSGSPIKIGKNTVTTIPDNPGAVDDNIFRIVNLSSNSSTGEIDFGGNPRKIGVGGDVIKITVTPSGLLSTTWYAVLDFVLR